MAHRSLIECDKCKKREVVTGMPYPDGWGLVVLTSWKRKANETLPVKVQDSIDLCPDHFGPLEQQIKLAVENGG